MIPRVLMTRALFVNRELVVLLAITSAIGSAWAAHAIGLSPALGAFIAGMLLADSTLAVEARIVLENDEVRQLSGLEAADLVGVAPEQGDEGRRAHLLRGEAHVEDAGVRAIARGGAQHHGDHLVAFAVLGDADAAEARLQGDGHVLAGNAGASGSG